jgi:hypothetical protein
MSEDEKKPAREKKPVVFRTLVAKTEKGAWAEAEVLIDLLLIAANDPEQAGAPGPEIDAVLTELTKGVRVLYLRWPTQWQRAYDNLATWCESGRVHLGRCRICNRWFLSRDKRQQRCHREECRAEAKRGLDRRNRKEETRRAAMARKAEQSS